MPVGNPNLTHVPTANGDTDSGWYNGRRAKMIQEKVSLAAGDSYATLKIKQPAYSHILHAELRHASTLSMTNPLGTSGVATAENLALVNSLSTGTVASTNVIIWGPTDASGDFAANELDTRNLTAVAIGQNDTSSEKTLYLTCGDLGAGKIQVDLTTPTTASYFDAAGDVYVRLYIEEFALTPAV